MFKGLLSSVLGIAMLLSPKLLIAQNAATVNLKSVEISDKKTAIFSDSAHHQSVGVDENLAKLPGIELIKRGGFASEISYRGLRTEQMGVTIDGMTMHAACTDRMDPITSYFENQNLAAIELVEGNENTSFTNTLNLKFNAPHFSINKIIKTQVSSFYQSVSNGFDNHASVAIATPKTVVSTGFTHHKHQNYFNGLNQKVNYTQYQKGNFYLNAKHRFGKNHVLKTNFIADKAQNVGFAALPMDVSLAQAYIGAITYVTYKKGYTYEARVYANHVYHVMDDSKRPNVPIRMDMPGQTQTIGAWVDLKKQFNRLTTHHRFEGITQNIFAEMTMFPKNETPMYMVTWPGINRNSAKFTGNLKYNLFIKTSVLLHYSAEALAQQTNNKFAIGQFEAYGHDITSIKNRFGGFAGFQINQQLNNNWKLTGMFQYKQRNPTVSEQFAFLLFNSADNHDYLGMPTLKNENSYQFESQLSFNTSKFNLLFNPFYYRFTNYIFGILNPSYFPMTIGAAGVRVYNNLPEAQLYGASLTTGWQISKKLMVVNAISSAFGNSKSIGFLPFISPVSGNLSLNGRAGQFNFMAQMQYAASQSRINYAYGEDFTPAFALLNTSVDRWFYLKNHKVTCVFKVTNWLNKNYNTHLAWNNIPQPGRNFVIGLKFDFNKQEVIQPPFQYN